MSFVFNYETFYNYYTNISNYFIDYQIPRPDIHYYNANKNKKGCKLSKLSANFIIVKEVRIYISIINNQLLFTIPQKLGNKYFDFHYHFGIKDSNWIKPQIDDVKIMHTIQLSKTKKSKQRNNKSKKKYKKIHYENLKNDGLVEFDNITPNLRIYSDNTSVIFFHKTEQFVEDDNENGVKSHNKCYFEDNLRIDEVKNIICIQENNAFMEKKYTKIELEQITEIISKPFRKTAGSLLKIKKNIRKKMIFENLP